MRQATFKCLFCLSSDERFTKVEHPIPESLGNDDLFLEKGFVCDKCNQYFGSKIESVVLGSPMFAIERVKLSVPTKKGKAPHFQSLRDFQLYPTGIRNTVVIAAKPDYWGAMLKYGVLVPPEKDYHDFELARLLLKMGLEIMLTTDTLDPYDSKFDGARQFARSPKSRSSWQFAEGLYPRQDDLINFLSKEGSATVYNETLYRYGMGKLPDGDVTFCFMYRQYYLACNLSGPSIANHVDAFNKMNEFTLNIREVKNV